MTEFEGAVGMAVEACSLALRDVLGEHADGAKVDTKTLKEVTAALKDLNGIGTADGSAEGVLTVRFLGGAEEASV